MQNEKKYIRYKGITRLPSDHDSFDGELEDAVNLSITGGELRPVLPPALIGTIPGQFLFVHKNQGYEHFIYLDGNVVKASNYEGGLITLIGNVVNIGVSSLVKVDAVGNILIILTTNDILYALWKDGTYSTLGSQIPFPLLNFYLTAQSTISIVKTYDSYAEDLTKIKTVSGSYVWRRGTPIPGTSSGRSTGIYRRSTGDQTADSTTISRNIVIGRTSDDRESIVSTDFENEIFGVINEKIAQIHENGSLLFPFFIRYAIRLYDGTLVRHSQPFLMLPTKFIPFLAGVTNYEENKVGFYFTPSKMYFNSSMIESLLPFADIAKSIDIFISEPIYTYVSDGHINGAVVNPLSSNPEKIFAGLIKSKESILEEIESVGSFFLLHSIPINEESASASGQLVEVKGIDNIVSKEPMSDDYLSHSKIIADNAYTYNHKLHLTGVKQQPFSGFCYSLNGDILYEIRDYGKVKASTAHYVGPQPFLFYPSIKAANIKYFIKTTHGLPGVIVKAITLSEHKYLNGAFYLDPDLNPVSLDSDNSGVTPDTHFQDLQSTLFVSVHQNPFVFPASSRITLPVGRIMAVASNTEAISQGQFGQFPLYAFTDDGIWALEVNNEGKYMARQPVSRDVVINPNIMQMDKALAFVTGKGLTLLSGVDTETISEIIRENNIRSSKISITGVISALETAEMLSVDIGTDLMEAYESIPFETFSAGADLAYDYITGGGRILVINPLYDYMYVFDLATSTWSKVLGSYKRIVNNYPDSYVQDGDGKVYNLAHIPDATNTKTTCMIITRPISYEDYNFVIRSLAHRGIFKSALNVVIYASRNGVDYAPIMHRREKLIRMNGSGFRYYKLLVIADLDPNEALSGIEIDFMLKYPNRMR